MWIRCASARACDATAGRSSGSQPAGLRESARVRSGFRARRFSILLPKAKPKLDLVTCAVILKWIHFTLSLFVSMEIYVYIRSDGQVEFKNRF